MLTNRQFVWGFLIILAFSLSAFHLYGCFSEYGFEYGMKTVTIMGWFFIFENLVENYGKNTNRYPKFRDFFS